MSLCAEEMRGSSWRGSATASATTWLDSRCVDVCGCAQACQCVCFCALCLCCLCGCVACMLVRSSKWRVINAISLSLVAHGMPFHPPPPHRPSHHRCQSKVTARSCQCCWICWWISWHHSVCGLTALLSWQRRLSVSMPTSPSSRCTSGPCTGQR